MMERWPERPIKDANGAPKSRYYVQSECTTGSPTGREPYGDGTPIVLAGVTTGQGGWESQPQGEGVKETMDRQDTGRYA